MADKVFRKKYQYDIALEDGVGAHLVAWVTGLMVFFVTLALAVSFALSSVTSDWVEGLSGSLTVEIRAPAADMTPAQKADLENKAGKILWLAKQHPAVASARALEVPEIRALVEPWLGENMAESIALPAVIDLKLAKDADTVKLQSDILALVPEASVDTHADALDDVRTLAATARTFVLLLTSVIVALAIVAVSGIVRSKFSIHRQEVETLHLIGASDEYIARQFRQHTLKGTLKGAAIGLAAMAATILAIGYATGTVDTALFPHLKLRPLEWLVLVFSPVAAGCIVAHFTAQKTVMAELARLP